MSVFSTTFGGRNAPTPVQYPLVLLNFATRIVNGDPVVTVAIFSDGPDPKQSQEFGLSTSDTHIAVDMPSMTEIGITGTLWLRDGAIMFDGSCGMPSSLQVQFDNAVVAVL